MSARTPLLFLGGLVLVCAGSAVGSLLTVAFLGAPEAQASSAPPAPASVTVETEALRRAVEDLTRELRVAAPTLRSEIPVEMPASLRIPGSASDLLPGSEPPERLRSEGSTSHAGLGALAATVHPPTPEQRDLMQELLGIEHAPRQKSHQFWTYQQVLERYGSPDEILGDASMSWFYKDPRTGITTQMKFCEGVLIAIYD